MYAINKSFGALVRNARADARLTQGQLAQRIGLSRTAVTNIESGNQGVALHQLFELAIALGRNPCDLLPKIGAGGREIPSQFLELVDGEKNQELMLGLMGRKS